MIGFIKKRIFSKSFAVKPPTSLEYILSIDGTDFDGVGALVEKDGKLKLRLSLSKKQILRKLEKEKTKKERIVGIWK